MWGDGVIGGGSGGWGMVRGEGGGMWGWEIGRW